MGHISSSLRALGSWCAWNCLPAFVLLCAGAAQASDGDYDASFFYGGIDYVDFGPPYTPDNAVDDVGTSIAVMQDGRLVLAGYRSDGSFTDGAKRYAIARLLPDGTTDPTFTLSDGSKVTGYCYMSSVQSPDTPESYATGVAVQTDGRVVIGGFCRDRGNAVQGPRHAFVARHNPSGGPDNTHISNWSRLVVFPSPYTDQYSTGRAIAIQPDGKIVLVGDVRDSTTGATHWFVARFNTDLSSDGLAHVFVVHNELDNEYAHAVAIQPDGKILVAGTSVVSANASYAAVIRLTTDLSIDGAALGGFYNGVLDACSNYLDNASSIAIDEGVIYVGGSTNGAGDSVFDYCLWTLGEDGGTFDIREISWSGRLSPGTSSAAVTAIAVQSDHKLVVTGQIHLSDGSYAIGTLRRSSGTSIADATFGVDGYSMAGYFSDQRVVNNLAYGMVLQNNHPVIVGSTDYYKTYAEEGTDFLVTRLNNEQVFAAGFEPFQ